MPNLPDAPEKTLQVLRILVTECLKRPTPSKTMTTSELLARRELVQTGVGLLRVLLKGKPLFVVADSWRFSDDFQKVIDLPLTRIVQIADVYAKICNQSSVNVVILNTGARTAKQQRIYTEIYGELKSLSNLTTWFVNDWR